jgi:hypothetical protein
MNIMKKYQQLFILCTIALLFNSCNSSKHIPVHVDCTVLDSKGIPLANRKVNLWARVNSANYNLLDSGTFIDSKTSDKDGKLSFDYGWQSDESTTTYYQVVPADDSLYAGVKYATIPTPSYNLKKETYNVNIVIEKLTPVKVRLKSRKSDVIEYGLRVFFDNSVLNSNIQKSINRDFLNFTQNKASFSLDTTFSVKAFTSQTLKLSGIIKHNTEPKSIIFTRQIESKFSRDSVFLIEF